MKKTALVIMAAGIGSRFGKGIKQLAQVGPSGEIIMDYSIHDALEATAQHQRHRKGKDELERAALCHVFCHTKPLPGRSLNISLPNLCRQKRPAGRGAGRFAFHEWYYTQLIVILQGVFLRFLRTTLLFSIGGFW